MVKISKDACIGCGACQALVSEVFDIGDDGLALVKSDAETNKYEEEIEDAISGCPTGAISND